MRFVNKNHIAHDTLYKIDNFVHVLANIYLKPIEFHRLLKIISWILQLD